jgi:hypothetical protein
LTTELFSQVFNYDIHTLGEKNLLIKPLVIHWYVYRPA